MLDIILYQPEIPPNAGNIIRLTANVGARLHFVRPLGFDLSDRQLARAGLDYHDLAHVTVHDSLDDCLATLPGCRLFALSTKGSMRHDQVSYGAGDALLFGPESRGLPSEVLSRIASDRIVRIPMRPGNRSINLSNAVAVLAFEAWRQQGFDGGS